ncbi:PDR/VanB family oxidoreductase [Acerihabitans arboris]|uniref:2Fe-2S iron-sulfur cluster binding domain-containing protein n=1 Tax=Acerihabitans arboris TaxID=2691583 RepID=A0A845SJ52_9GAMM|nr:PDR/VanB family oxidoreductase [Acerihabitans arboris]NDL63969.1 2Fe-2S iron-sulfur cluster binding domain-containing protein [Acerihabitans arboris]
MDASQHFFNVRVVNKIHRGTGVVFLTLARPDGSALPSFSAGAHIQLRLPDGLIRQYSLCGDAARQDSYRLAILATHRSRGGGGYIRDGLRAGDLLEISAPRNDFPLADRPGASLLLAGGIGITPLLSMALALKARGREFQLHYFGRADTLSAFAQQPEYRALAENITAHCRVVGSGAPPAGEAVSAPDDIAVAAAGMPAQGLSPAGGASPAACGEDGQAALLARLLADWQRRHGGFSLYYCGSLAFMQSVRDRCEAAGMPAEDCHYECFTPPEVRDESVFDVEIFSTGDIIPIPANLSIADALNQAGVEVEISCGLGICGTCLAGVKAGIPDHRDEYLSPAEKDANTKILLCCSRARSARLVIDL